MNPPENREFSSVEVGSNSRSLPCWGEMTSVLAAVEERSNRILQFVVIL